MGCRLVREAPGASRIGRRDEEQVNPQRPTNGPDPKKTVGLLLYTCSCEDVFLIRGWCSKHAKVPQYLEGQEDLSRLS